MGDGNQRVFNVSHTFFRSRIATEAVDRANELVSEPFDDLLSRLEAELSNLQQRETITEEVPAPEVDS